MHYGVQGQCRWLYRHFPSTKSSNLHSTETAVLRVLSDIFEALDRGDWAALTYVLDLSAAFDTVDHTTLIRRLQISYGFNDVVLGWFSSYLHDRSQYVRCSNSSMPSVLLCGVPQGSVLGPILFLLYTADLIRLITTSGLCPHIYADDTQIYSFCAQPPRLFFS